MGELRLTGIVQVSGEKDVSYEQAGTYLAQRVGAKPSLVRGVTSREAGFQFESLPSHTTLDTIRLSRDCGMKPPGIWPTLDSIEGL